MLLLTRAPILARARPRLIATGGANATDAGGSSTTAVTAGLNMVGATLLIAGCAQYFGGGSSGNVQASDSLGNIWTPLTPKPDDTFVSRVALFYVNSNRPKVGPSQTFTASGTETYPLISVWGFSGTSQSPYCQEIWDQAGGTEQDSAGGFKPSGLIIVSILGIEGGVVTSLAATAPMIGSYLFNGQAGSTTGGAAYMIRDDASSAINPTFTWGTSRTAVAISSASFR